MGELVRIAVKKGKNSRRSAPLAIMPVRASEITASVELTPPLCDSSEVQEKVTREAAVDIERYVHLADKLLVGEKTDEESQKQARAKAS